MLYVRRLLQQVEAVGSECFPALNCFSTLCMGEGNIREHSGSAFGVRYKNMDGVKFVLLYRYPTTIALIIVAGSVCTIFIPNQTEYSNFRQTIGNEFGMGHSDDWHTGMFFTYLLEDPE